MNWDTLFFINSFLLGVGLAMDSFSVSVANALDEPGMSMGKRMGISFTFGFFQALMPLIGWLCVRTVVDSFRSFEKLVPWIALILLLFIGGKMLLEGIRGEESGTEKTGVGFWGLMLQGVATAIDALSVGFATSHYPFPMAFVSSLIIGAVTYVICIFGCRIGSSVGNRLSGRASILGGLILIFIGIEIFVRGVFAK